jgi:hypothetical protein
MTLILSLKKSIGIIGLISFLITTVSISADGNAGTDRTSRHNNRIYIPNDKTPPRFIFDKISSEKINFSDIQISENIAPASFNQTRSSMASLPGGQVVICWQDDRLGNQMIFRQVYDEEGNPGSANTLAIGRDDGNDLIEPKVVSDASGGYYLAWRDIASGNIFAARFGNDHNLLIGPFSVFDYAGQGFAGPFDITGTPGGHLVVAWEHNLAGSFIALRVFSSDGLPLSEAVTINNDGGTVSHWVPSVTADNLGNLAVVWEDYRNGNADIFMQFVKLDGTLSGVNIGVVEGAFDNEPQYSPKIEYSETDDFIAAWLDKRDAVQRIFIQQANISEGLVGTNVNISDNAEDTEDWDIALAANSTGELAVAWASIGHQNRILIQKFLSGLVADGPIITVYQNPTGLRWETSLLFDALDKLYCGWTDFRPGTPDIFLQIFDADGNPFHNGDLFIVVNDDQLGANSGEPVITSLDENRSMIVFSDSRDDTGDIYFQIINDDGSLIGANTKVNTDVLPVRQFQPDMAVYNDQISIVWVDERAVSGIFGQRIFSRSYLLDGTPAGSDFMISDLGSLSQKSDPSIAMSDIGHQTISWIEEIDDDNQILARFIPLPPDEAKTVNVSQAGIETDNIDLSVALDENNIFSVGFLSRGIVGGPVVIVARYSDTGDPINRFSFSSDQTGVEISHVSATVDNTGLIYILWQGEDALGTRLFLTILNSDGSLANPTFEVTDLSGTNPKEPNISVGNNGMIIASWIDHRNSRPAAYYQIFDSQLNPVSANRPFSAESTRLMASPVAAGTNTKIRLAWADSRNNGLNIFARQSDYTPTDIDDAHTNKTPSEYILDQNYPNPFNPGTSIEFRLPTRNRVTLIIYDILGRNIRTLTDRIYDAGVHSVLWDGNDHDGRPVASGIYFYRMKAGDLIRARKMILLK